VCGTASPQSFCGAESEFAPAGAKSKKPPTVLLGVNGPNGRLMPLVLDPASRAAP
jgi:hypothetical protein